MADNFGELAITIRVNKDTGQLEVLKGELAKTGKSVEDLGKQSEGTKSQLEGLVGSLAKLATAGAILSFFKTALAEAAEEQEALRHLKAQMDALGLAFDENKEKVNSWAQAMMATAHIEDTQVVDALGRTIQRVGDLDQAMKLVQLAQDIAVASGKNFDQVLDGLARTAGGASRGLMMLRMEFGKQLEGVETNAEALQRLANNYGGAASKAESATLAFGDMKIEMSEIAERLGGTLLPSLQSLMATMGGPLLSVLSTVGNTVGVFLGLFVNGVASAAALIRVSVEGLVEVVYNLFTGNFSGALDAAKVFGESLVDEATKQSANINKILDDSDKQLEEDFLKTKTKAQAALLSLNNLKAAATDKDRQKELAEDKKALEQGLKNLKANETLELAALNLSRAQRIQIINTYAARELNLIRTALRNKVLTEREAAQQSEAIVSENMGKILSIEQEGLRDRTKLWEGWADETRNIEAGVEDAIRKGGDEMFKSTSDSLAKMLVAGQGFSVDFQQLMQNMVEQIIAELIRLELKMLAVRAATSLMSSGASMGAGSFLPGPLGGGMLDLFADGGRVTQPTLAVVGEGGEPESIVPDSKAAAFAKGVLGAGSKGAPASIVQYNTFNIQSVIGVDSTKQVMAEIIAEMRKESAMGVRFGRAASDVSSRNSGRSV